MPFKNTSISATGKLFLILMFIAMLGACSESSSPPSKQEAASPAEKRLAQLQKQADAGDADAQYNLGLMYDKGEGVPKDAAKAVELYQKAAAQGVADAQYNMGLMYYKGEGVLKDAAKAAEWYQKAAAQGVAKAQVNLGLMYAKGEGVLKDAVKAVELWQKAAAQGVAEAQYNLGLMYEKGEGIPKDAVKAVEWYQKAVVQGNAKAQFNLGWMYYYGEGVPKDAAKAAEWYQKAAAQGNANAQVNLGVLYDKGEGVPRDFVLSYAWANLAAAQEGKAREPAKKNRGLIKLSSAQRAEAERLSSNWKVGQVLRREGESGSGIGSAAKVTGTAFVISTEGHAITNYHVVAGCKELRVQSRTELIQLITRDEVSDLALLKITGESYSAATLTPNPASLRQGQDIVVFGFPLDSVLSSGGNLTPGVVSAITGLGNNSNQIQITASIQPGSSGSPVMDKKGHVVGVVSMKLSDLAMAKYTGNLPQNVNFAINGQTLKTFLDANRVPYKSGWSFFSREKSLADIGDEARKWTTVVECWR